MKTKNPYQNFFFDVVVNLFGRWVIILTAIGITIALITFIGNSFMQIFNYLIK